MVYGVSGFIAIGLGLMGFLGLIVYRVLGLIWLIGF